MKRLLLVLGLSFTLGIAIGQTVKNELIEIDLGRTDGLFTKSPVYIRAIALTSTTKPPSDTALLYFRGWPGIAQISAEGDWRLRGNMNFLLKAMDYVLDQDLMLVQMDCPTDQWGLSGYNPIRCNDAYRESAQYANEVRQVMTHLRERNGIRKFFILGHSYGTISSRWLAINLGDEIVGSIHSASVTKQLGSPSSQYGASVSRMDMNKAKAPYTYMHNADDLCMETSFTVVKSMAGENLITMHGGVPAGDICGGKHYHSYGGIELDAAKALVAWIRANAPNKRPGEPSKISSFTSSIVPK
jgi:hypothetical protein